jgi:hypothetical protein
MMDRKMTEYLLGAFGYLVAAVGAFLASDLFFQGVGSVPDSFLGNVISVDGIAVGVFGLAVPVAIHLLGQGDPVGRFLADLADDLKGRRMGRLSLAVLLRTGAFASVVPSPLSLIIDSVVSLSASIFLALYAILHGDATLPAYLSFLLFMFGVVLLLEVILAMAAVYRTRKRAAAGPGKDGKAQGPEHPSAGIGSA